MTHSENRRRLIGFVFAMLLTLGTASATVVSVHNPGPNNVAVDPTSTVLSTAVTDYGWHGPATPALTAAAVESSRNLLDYPYNSSASGQAEDLSDVIRHRGFGKALLIIIACGALIRLLTSPAYLKFIADVLDPRAF